MTISQAIEKFERMDPEMILTEAVNQAKEQFLTLNKQQLYEGKLKTGQDVRPAYVDDPYFKSREQAQAYSNYKDKITPNSRRRRGIPNLYINGYYYDSWVISVANKQVLINATAETAPEIEATFGTNMYGLSPETIPRYQAILKPVIIELVKQHIR